MSNVTIAQATLDAFRDNVRHLAQQKISKARQFTDFMSAEAETGQWDRLSAGEQAAKGRKAATNETGRVWTRRIAIASPYDDGEVTEVEDPSMMLVDPNSQLIRSMGFAAGRQIDRVIFAAAIGNATNSVRNRDGSNTPTQIALPAGQTVGDGSAVLSFDLVNSAQEVFIANDIDAEVPKVLFVSPRGLKELMADAKATNNDFVQAQALQQYGVVPNWMGFTWVSSTLLPIPATGERSLIAMTYDAVGFHEPMPMRSFCQQDPGLSYAWVPYCVQNIGAVRVEDEKVVEIHVADATAP